MTQTSAFSKYLHMSFSAFDERHSVAAGYAHVLRNNIAHLTDSCTQMRINWQGFWQSTQPEGVNVPCIYHQEFPLTWLGAAKPANLDVIIETRGNDVGGTDNTNRRVLIVPASTPIGSATRPILDVQDTTADTVLDVFTAEVTSSEHITELETAWEPLYTVGDPAVVIQMCMLRLEVWQWLPIWAIEDTFSVQYVMVREFA